MNIHIESGVSPTDTSDAAKVARWMARRQEERLKKEQLAGATADLIKDAGLDEETAKLVDMAVRKAKPENKGEKADMSLIPARVAVVTSPGGILMLQRSETK